VLKVRSIHAKKGQVNLEKLAEAEAERDRLKEVKIRAISRDGSRLAISLLRLLDVLAVILLIWRAPDDNPPSSSRHTELDDGANPDRHSTSAHPRQRDNEHSRVGVSFRGRIRHTLPQLQQRGGDLGSQYRGAQETH